MVGRYALVAAFQTDALRIRQCRHLAPNYSDDRLMNIFDIRVYARRCEKPHLGKKEVPGRPGHLRNHFNIAR
jgi:hypothetical protein